MRSIHFQRHCERSEAIYRPERGLMDCFVASLLAMTDLDEREFISL